MRQHCYKGLSPPFRIQGFFGNRSHDLRRSDFSDAAYGLLPRLMRNRSPCRPFHAAISCYTLKYCRVLHHLLRLSNRHRTVVTLVFSPWFDFSNDFACSSRTGCVLRWSLIVFLFLTLAPHDCVTYCQARGLSGNSSPCGECALSLFGTCPRTGCLLGWFSTILLVSHPGTT